VADVTRDGWRRSLRRRWRWLPLLAVVLIGACNLSARALAWRVSTDLPPVSGIEPVGRLGDDAISESSGLTPSGTLPGLFWTLNDSGHEPRLFAIEPTGAVRGSLIIPGATNTDWEAMAQGPCPTGRCVYVGDVGDNMARRDRVIIWRVPEPDTPPPWSTPAEPLVRALEVHYVDGPRDVEALYVAPDTSLWLITKRPAHRWLPSREPVRLYRVPGSAWTSSAQVTADRVGTLPIVPGQLSARDWVTDAALSAPHADGTRQLAVLTYGSIHVFAADPVTGRPGQRLAHCALPIDEHDAEAVAWLPDGRLLVTNEGTRSLLYAGRCGTPP